LLELARGEDNLIKADEAAREMQRKLLKREPAPSLLQQLLNRLDDRTYEIAQTIHELLAEPKDAASALKFLIDNPTLGSIELA
ncbi:hypothetical protein CYG49_03355, partial [Candidatus Saccharibacteria bacterium]